MPTQNTTAREIKNAVSERAMYDWTEIKRLESENEYENFRAVVMCCSTSYVSEKKESCSVCHGDHVMVERRLRCTSVTCALDRRCPVVWKVLQCTARDWWEVLVNDQAHGRNTDVCRGRHKPRVTKVMKAFIADEDDNDGTPRIIETRMKKKRDLGVPVYGWPTLAQIANALKKLRGDAGRRNTIEGIESFVSAHLLNADSHLSPEKGVIFGPLLKGNGQPHVGSGNNDDPFILGVTSVEKIEAAVSHASSGRFTLFHADATFKLSDCAYPVITCGFTDSSRSYQLVALFVVSQRTIRDFKMCFDTVSRLARQLCGKVLDVDAFMGDADDAQVAGLHGVLDFKDVTPLMCYFHVLYNVRKKTTHLHPSLRMMIMTSINDMHYSLCMAEFVRIRAEELERWQQHGELSVFCDYFVRQWLTGRFWRWQVFHTPPGYATTNNPCEVYNSSIKSYTRRRRYHMTKLLGKLIDLVESHKNVSLVGDDFIPKPTKDVVVAAQKMAKSGRTTVQMVNGTTIARVLYQQASATEDKTTNPAAFVKTFDKGCELGKKIMTCRNPGRKIDAEKKKAAALHKRVCSWSLWRAHTRGMPGDGWLVDCALRRCGCRYFFKFKICAHLLIADSRDNFDLIGKQRKILDRSRTQGILHPQTGICRNRIPAPSSGNVLQQHRVLGSQRQQDIAYPPSPSAALRDQHQPWQWHQSGVLFEEQQSHQQFQQHWQQHWDQQPQQHWQQQTQQQPHQQPQQPHPQSQQQPHQQPQQPHQQSQQHWQQPSQQHQQSQQQPHQPPRQQQSQQQSQQQWQQQWQLRGGLLEGHQEETHEQHASDLREWEAIGSVQQAWVDRQIPSVVFPEWEGTTDVVGETMAQATTNQQQWQWQATTEESWQVMRAEEPTRTAQDSDQERHQAEPRHDGQSPEERWPWASMVTTPQHPQRHRPRPYQARSKPAYGRPPLATRALVID